MWKKYVSLIIYLFSPTVWTQSNWVFSIRKNLRNLSPYNPTKTTPHQERKQIFNRTSADYHRIKPQITDFRTNARTERSARFLYGSRGGSRLSRNFWGLRRIQGGVSLSFQETLADPPTSAFRDALYVSANTRITRANRDRDPQFPFGRPANYVKIRALDWRNLRTDSCLWGVWFGDHMMAVDFYKWIVPELAWRFGYTSWF